jgi:hypothetical protein
MELERFPLQRCRITNAGVTVVGNTVEVPLAKEKIVLCGHWLLPLQHPSVVVVQAIASQPFLGDQHVWRVGKRISYDIFARVFAPVNCGINNECVSFPVSASTNAEFTTVNDDFFAVCCKLNRECIRCLANHVGPGQAEYRFHVFDDKDG